MVVWKIKSFEFGKITVNDSDYNKDLIILPGEIYYPWWRKEGHRIYPEDLKKLEDYQPEVVIFGIGTAGRVDVPDSVIKWLREKGMKVIVEPTDKACSYYNEYCGKKPTAAYLHLTC